MFKFFNNLFKKDDALSKKDAAVLKTDDAVPFPLLELPKDLISHNFAAQLSITQLSRLARTSKGLNILLSPKINEQNAARTALVVHSDHPVKEKSHDAIIADEMFFDKHPLASSLPTMRPY